MEWNPLQSIAKGFVLTDLLKSEFVEYLENHFEDKRIEAINIQIRVRDKKITDYMDNEIVSIANRSGQDTLLKKSNSWCRQYLNIKYFYWCYR